jgi:DNA-directed RNA polymerase specialized sigma54-like protein
MAQWLEEGVVSSDASLTERLKKEYGIKISRRTVNAVRNELIKTSKV